MYRCQPVLIFGFCWFLAATGISSAAEAITLENAVDPGANRRDEAIATQFSLEKAVAFLDTAALHWQKQQKCFTCHTNYAHLYARPETAAAEPAAVEVRKFA